MDVHVKYRYRKNLLRYRNKVFVPCCSIYSFIYLCICDNLPPAVVCAAHLWGILRRTLLVMEPCRVASSGARSSGASLSCCHLTGRKDNSGVLIDSLLLSLCSTRASWHGARHGARHSAKVKQLLDATNVTERLIGTLVVNRDPWRQPGWIHLLHDRSSLDVSLGINLVTTTKFLRATFQLNLMMAVTYNHR